MIGFYGFFLISTIKGRVEANWTVPAIVGMIILSHQFMVERPAFQKWIFKTVMFSLALVLIFRVYLVMDIQGPKWIKKDEFHHNQTWADQVKLQSRGLPLVSISSYQQASKYWFYSGVQSYSLNTPDYRRNNFNYWPISDSLLGKTVYVLGQVSPVLYEKVPGRNRQVNGGAVVDSFYSFSKLQFENIRDISAGNGIVSLDCDITIPDHYLYVFQQQPYGRATVQLAILNNDTVPDYFAAKMQVNQIKSTDTSVHLQFQVPLSKGSYFGRLATESRVTDQPTLNSSTFRFEVK
jgi:hypothetical protein